MPPALTSLSHGAGCGCKLSAADLRPIVAGLPRPTDPRVLVATDTADDAGVVQLSEEIAIVQTVDFFTPIVDDPYAFGRIAPVRAAGPADRYRAWRASASSSRSQIATTSAVSSSHALRRMFGPQ